jgi:hypothetical protein
MGVLERYIAESKPLIPRMMRQAIPVNLTTIISSFQMADAEDMEN